MFKKSQAMASTGLCLAAKKVPITQSLQTSSSDFSGHAGICNELERTIDSSLSIRTLLLIFPTLEGFYLLLLQAKIHINF